MSNKNTKTMLLGTLTLVLCSIIIGIFSFTPNKEIVVPEIEVKTYEVLFDTNGGTAIAAIQIDEGGIIQTPEIPEREGYIFDGWLLDGEAFDFSMQVSGDITLVASWKEIRDDVNYFKVSFDTDGGTELPAETIEEGSVAYNPGEPKKDGYEFVEWRYEGEKFDFETPITKDITLVAYYEEIREDLPKYTVSFNTNGGSGSCTDQTITEGSYAKKPSCKVSKSGYDFVGWNTSKSASSDNLSKTKITKDTTFYAVFTVQVKKYTVKFDTGGHGSCTSQTVEAGKSPKNPSCSGFSWTGHTAAGWSTRKDSPGGYDITSDKIESDTTYYAKWKLNQYNVVAYDVSGKQCDSAKVDYNSTVSSNFASECNKTSDDKFLGWNTSKNASSANFTNNTPITANTDIYPAYKDMSMKIGCYDLNTSNCKLVYTDDNSTLTNAGVDKVYYYNGNKVVEIKFSGSGSNAMYSINKDRYSSVDRIYIKKGSDVYYANRTTIIK